MTTADNLHKLILGTAQFGLDYGISNTRGQLTQSEVEAILFRAAEAGITTLDTATAYGESEVSIGQALQNGTSFKIITKYPPNAQGKTVKQAFLESMERLGQSKLHAYLLHSFETYRETPSVLDELLELKEASKVDKIGVSIYHPEEAVELLNAKIIVDIVQFPYSVFDRRFESILPTLRSKGIETHVRSIYLQGLYFMQPGNIPLSLQKAAPKVAELQQLAKDYNLSLGAMLMGFVTNNTDITNIVIGVESLQTLEQNIEYAGAQVNESLLLALQSFEEQDDNIILPYKWAKA